MVVENVAIARTAMIKLCETRNSSSVMEKGKQMQLRFLVNLSVAKLSYQNLFPAMRLEKIRS